MRLLLVFGLIASLSGCAVSIGGGSDSHDSDCVIKVNKDESVSIKGQCPDNMRVDLGAKSKEVTVIKDQ